MANTFDTEKVKEILQGGTAEAEEILRDPTQVDGLLGQFEQKLKEVPGIGNKLGDVSQLLAMVKSHNTKEYTKVSPKTIVLIVAAIAYFVKKKDIIPDSVPVLGHADDIAVIALALKLAAPDLKAFSEWKKGSTTKETEKEDDDD